MERAGLILVLNSGSSSLKYRLIDGSGFGEVDAGLIERIGEPDGVADHDAALRQVLDRLQRDGRVPRAVGHRVVHGGSRFTAAALIDDAVVAAIRELIPLAPLHNPANLAGIVAARARLPGVPQVAVFDTAFHTSLPAAAATYAIDRDLARRLGIRRYGFHGTSHEYVAGRTAALLGRPLGELNLIVLHLGNGASAAAVAGGRSVETSMGLSPLEGLVMGTRPGDLDPGVLLALQRDGGLSVDQLDDLLEHHSGLAGLCGVNDMREVLARRAAGDADAALALDVYGHRVRRYIGAYHAALGRLDAITFTAGVGENSAQVRVACVTGLEMWGIAIDPDRNASATGARVVSPAGAAVAVCVVPTDEELAIAEKIVALLDHGPA